MKLVIGRRRINIAVVYRPPTSSSYGVSVSRFCSDLADFLDELLALPDESIICGDFNCPGADSTSVDVLFDVTLLAHQLRQHVDGPKHRAGNLLDVLLTHENSRLVVNCTRCDPGLSDHSMVLTDLDARRPPPLIRRIRYRSIKRVDPDAFCTILTSLSDRPMTSMRSRFNSMRPSLVFSIVWRRYVRQRAVVLEGRHAGCPTRLSLPSGSVDVLRVVGYGLVSMEIDSCIVPPAERPTLRLSNRGERSLNGGYCQQPAIHVGDGVSCANYYTPTIVDPTSMPLKDSDYATSFVRFSPTNFAAFTTKFICDSATTPHSV